MSTTNTPTSYVGKHIFTQEEKNQKTEQMLQAMRQKEEIEAEFKTSKSNYKSKIDSKEAEIKLTANLLNAGFEDRTYSCLLTKDFEVGKRLYHEIGSNKLVGEEPLTASDYQTQMDLDEKAIKANNEAADQAIELLHSGEEPEPFELTPEDIAAAEQGPEYTVEPDSNPLEINEETPTVEPEVISKPTKQKEVKKKEEPTKPLEDVSDGIFGLDESEDEDNPFSFDDI
jgi:hypothetical protein